MAPGSGHMTDSSPEGSIARANSTGTAIAAKAARVPWRPVGTSVISAGVPMAAGITHPLIGAGIAIIELAVALTVIGAALFGSPELSERAFRLLRWIANRPEPPTPGAAASSPAPSGVPKTSFTDTSPAPPPRVG